MQGNALPSTVSTTQAQDVAPDFYTNYLQDIANLGQNAVNQGGVAGLGPLQQQAMDMAPQAAFSGANTAGNAAGMLETAGNTTAPSVIQNYMNPYTNNVVDEMARLQQQNIQRNVMPALAGAGVGSGGFGSSRQATATGQSLADMQSNLTGQQYGALNTGYQNAMIAAQADLTRQMQAGSDLNQVANTQSNIGQSGLKTLMDMGGVQQAQGQKQLDYPMLQAQNFAKLLQGYNVPMGKTTQTTAPGQQGQFTNSPLSQIAGLASLFQAISGSGGTTSGTTTPATGSGLTADQIATLKNSADPTVQALITSLGLASGGSVSYANGGAIQGGLQNFIQGGQQPQDTNLNVPQPNTNSVYSNSNIPQSGYNPPRLTPQNLNDSSVYDPTQQQSMGGSVGSPDFNPNQG